MIPTTVQTDPSQRQIKTVTPVKPITPATPAASSHSHGGDTNTEFVVGQHYKGLVETRLSNGNYNVLISNKLVQMQLPANAQPGDKLELLLVSNDPKLQFVLQQDNPTSLAKTLTNQATISPVGKFLDVLLQNRTSLPTPATNTTTALADLSINRQILPSLLQKAILQSGLFYESHLVKWINGKTTLNQLAQEPQNKLNLPTDAPSKATNTVQSALPVSTQSLSIVQQQLLTLETGHINWRGEIWKDQVMEWNIYEDTSQKNPDRSETAARWNTTLKITLPELGKITANINLSSDAIQLKLIADNDGAKQLLSSHLVPLKTRLHNAGLPTSSVSFRTDE